MVTSRGRAQGALLQYVTLPLSHCADMRGVLGEYLERRAYLGPARRERSDAWMPKQAEPDASKAGCRANLSERNSPSGALGRGRAQGALLQIPRRSTPQHPVARKARSYSAQHRCRGRMGGWLLVILRA